MVFGSFGVFASSGYELVDYQDPKVDEQGEFYIGDRIFLSTQGHYKSCITPTKEHKIKQIGIHVYKRNIPICKESPKDKYYIPDYINFYLQQSAIGPQSESMKVGLKQTKSTYRICQRKFGMNTACVKNLSSDELIINKETFVNAPEYPIKSIVFVGKLNGVLKFLYEETLQSIYSPIAKSTFGGDSQTIQFEVDPVESNVFSFKGALFEIIDSSSSSIKIKVIRDFPK